MEPDFYKIKLSWLLRMRWWAAVGQSLVIGLVYWGASIRLPLFPMFLVVSTTLLSNIVGNYLNRTLGRRGVEMTLRMLLILDVILLSSLLYYTGGARNPFHYLYIIHVALAALVLTSDWAWIVALLSGGLLGVLYIYYEPLPLQDVWLREVMFPLGAWVAFFVASGFTAFFVSRLSKDLSEREKVVGELRERELTREKLASLATLSAGAAHELANPLATIAVAAKELARKFSKSPHYTDQEREDISLIRDEVAQCQEILAMMSGVSGNVAGEPLVKFSVDKLLKDLVSYFQARHTIDFKMHVPADSPEWHGPRKALEQSLKSVFSNAIQASEISGTPVRVDFTQNGTEMNIIIEDKGTGMTPEVLKKIGEPFFTTKPTGQGMGLGLFLTKTVIDSLGGTLEIKSAPNAGTRVTLIIPLQRKGAVHA